ncbi:MAG: MFS transporter [Chloroflexi bacterium HGW-Chloroflexi-8]|nr:MAG: MFS transporter [Chloroflexi bacterium HGW-Chloroflexi-8]
MNNRKNLIILFFTLVVVMMGFGIIIPIMPFYVESFGGGGLGLGLLMAIFSVMQFIFAPIWGALSDRYGRKPIILIGALGNALSLLMFGFSTQLWMMYVARALGGILSSATLPTAMAYIGDTTDEQNRGGGMGVVGAAMGMGLVLGPGLGGTLAKTSLSTPFFFAAALSLVAVLLIFIFVPESLEKSKRDPSSAIKLPKISILIRELRGPLGFMFLLAFIVMFALTNFEGIFGLYAQYRFDFNAAQVGLVMTIVGLVSTVAQGLLTGPTTKRFGERNVIKISLIASSLGFFLMILAKTTIPIYLTVGFFVLSNAMLRPAIQSIISKEAKSGQGIAMGLTNSYMSLGRIVGPIWAGTMIDINVIFPYLSGAIVFLFLFIAALIWMKPAIKKDDPILSSINVTIH